MKSKISQAAKKSVSLLLAILMMFSMLTVAMTVTVNAADTKTIYFDNSKTKWDNVYITGNQWGWGESRTTMTPVDSNNKYGYYSYEGDISTEFVFRAQDSWNDNDKSTQTVNITTIEYGKVYVPSSKENDGKWTGTWEEYNTTPEPTPAKSFYLYHWTGNENVSTKMDYDATAKVYWIKTTADLLSNGGRFKIADDINASSYADSRDHVVNYNISNSNIVVSDAAKAAGVSVRDTDPDSGDNNDIKITTSDDSYKDKLRIEYVPDEETGLKGIITIKLQTEGLGTTDPTTPPTTACFTIKPTSLSNMGVNEVAPITATHSATCAGTLAWSISEGTDRMSRV